MIFKTKKPKQNKANICMDCKNACGGCPWTRWDEERNRVAFEPVPGWTAKKVPFRAQSGRHGNRSNYTDEEFSYTYKITACPLFERG